MLPDLMLLIKYESTYVRHMLVDLVQLVSVTDISGITEWVSDNFILIIVMILEAGFTRSRTCGM